ncbi:MAG TPA: hypothetical protein VJU15_05995 [Gemmatimonadales bacterium]|nr:hypothetical protein [Gemmatimonadales bacterium]
MPYLMIALLLVLACRESKPPPRTERERDSTIAQSRLPGAAGVKAALKVSDSAAARRARLDSVAQ